MTQYRPDIDGLRAVSIIVVLLFHIGFDDWSGGYVGVDVFFVISGYLITSLIAADIANGRFSLAHFYERRIRRLLPATIPVIIFTSLFAWGFYTTDRFLEYAKSLVSFITYTSNWFFLSTRGYFAGDDATTPLLHAWSLAVEEQFYLVFPFLLLLLARRPALTRPVLAVLALASLVHAELLLRGGHTDQAFFSSLTRFWELMLGALLALSPAIPKALERFSTPMRVAGLALILWSVFTYTASTPFPGLNALAPVLGAVLILAASPARSDPILTALKSAPAVYVGRISYSLYLWHWPIFGAMNVLVFDPNDLPKVIAIVLSFAAAALSYHYVEQPFRKRAVLPSGRSLASLLAATTAASIAFGAYGWQTGGWPGRLPPQVEEMAARATAKVVDPEHCFNAGTRENKFCLPDGTDRLDVVLLGDSHAQSLVPAVKKIASDNGLKVGFALRGDCPPLLGLWREKDPTALCRRFNDESLAFIEKTKPRVVLVVARWSVYTSGRQYFLDDRGAAASRPESLAKIEQGLARTLAAMEAAGARVIFVEQVPQNLGDLPSATLVLTRLGLPLDLVAERTQDHRKKQAPMTALLDKAAASHAFTRIDPTEHFCKTERCTVESGGRLLYFDNDHLNADGSLFLAPFLAPRILEALAAVPTR